MLGPRPGRAICARCPPTEGRPPFLVVVDVGHIIELYSDFSRPARTYMPFPDPRSPPHSPRRPARTRRPREAPAPIWTEPLSLDPARRRARHPRDRRQPRRARQAPRSSRPRPGDRGRLPDALPVHHVRRGRRPAARSGFTDCSTQHWRAAGTVSACSPALWRAMNQRRLLRRAAHRRSSASTAGCSPTPTPCP